MVNVAEEVKGVRRTLPIAIIITLGITTILYMLVTVLAVLAMPIDTLSGAEAPLALLYTQVTGLQPTVISFIAVVAVLNGALIQVIMASRVLYGLSREGWLPVVISRVNPRTQTPVVATMLASMIVLVLALWLPLITLALTTSMTVLVVYGTVNLALWRIKRRDPSPAGVITFPLWIPIVGFAANAIFIVFQVSRWLAG
jgi:amino acid transporter